MEALPGRDQERTSRLLIYGRRILMILTLSAGFNPIRTGQAFPSKREDASSSMCDSEGYLRGYSSSVACACAVANRCGLRLPLQVWPSHRSGSRRRTAAFSNRAAPAQWTLAEGQRYSLVASTVKTL